ncbi:MAG: class I SAM-dependent methyltransferase [bacterium]|nr:class I SAM-dependent methyltransferase [bacterium]
MKRVRNDLEIISGIVPVEEKVVVDVGCGTGDTVRRLTRQGARVTGVDRLEMLEKAKRYPPVKDEEYLPGKAENLPFKNNFADIILYFASFHHVPVLKLNHALEETRRVLKTDGIAIFVEPVGRKGSYFELVRLVEDEREIQLLAYNTIKKAADIGLEMMGESMIYMERSFEDFIRILNTFVDDNAKRDGYMKQARKVMEHVTRDAGVELKDYRFKSICRVNTLRRRDPV